MGQLNTSVIQGSSKALIIDDQEKQSYHSYPQSWEEVEEAHVEQE